MSAWDLSMFGKLVDGGTLSPQMESGSITASRSASTSSSSLAIGSLTSARLGQPSSVAGEVSSRTSSFARLDLGDRKSGGDLTFSMDDVAPTAQRPPQARRPLSGASSLPSRFMGSSPPMAIPSSLARRAFADDQEAPSRSVRSAWDANRRRASGGGGRSGARTRGASDGIASSALPASALDSLDDPWGTQQESFSTRMAAMRLREAEKARIVAQEEERVRVLAHKKELARMKRLSALGLTGDGGRAASATLGNSLSRPRPIATGSPALLPMNQRVAPNESGGGASSISNGSEGSSPIKERRSRVTSRSDGDSEEQPRDVTRAQRRSLGYRTSIDSEGVESVSNAFRSSREGAKRGSVFSDVDKEEGLDPSSSPSALSPVDRAGACYFMYRYSLRESCSQFDSLPLTSLTSSPANAGGLGAALRRGAPDACATSAKVAAADDRFASHSHGLLAGFDGEAALISDAALFGVTDDALGFAGDVDDELCFDLEL
jgi:hypothetical protein